jgi:hypothetical protein
LQIRRIESETLSEWKHLAASWKIQLNRAQTPQDKGKYEKLLSSAQDHIKQFIEAGVKKLKKSMRLIDLSMTKKETEAILSRIRAISNNVGNDKKERR